MIKRILIGLLLLAVVFVVGGLLLPSSPTVQRSTEIAAPVSKVFAIVASYQRFNEWSPWSDLDPNAKYSFSGPAQGKGAKMSWTGDKVGSGSQEIVAVEVDKRVDVALDFGDMGTSKASLLLEPGTAGANTTKVTWLFIGETGNNPAMRWMGLMFDRWIGADYEKGLARLKALAEKP